MPQRIELTPDTPETRKEVLQGIASLLEGSSHGELEDGQIEFTYRPDLDPSVQVSFRGENLYFPTMQIFEEAIRKTRSGIIFVLREE